MVAAFIHRYPVQPRGKLTLEPEGLYLPVDSNEDILRDIIDGVRIAKRKVNKVANLFLVPGDKLFERRIVTLNYIFDKSEIVFQLKNLLLWPHVLFVFFRLHKLGRAINGFVP